MCVGEAMGEADGQGGGLATFKESSLLSFLNFFLWGEAWKWFTCSLIGIS